MSTETPIPAPDLLGAVRRKPNGKVLAVLWPSPPSAARWMTTDAWGSCGYETDAAVADWPVVGAVPYSPAAGFPMPTPGDVEQEKAETGPPTVKPDANDWDWREVVIFDGAIESEGYEDAFDNYGPLFRRPELIALESDMSGLRDFMQAHEDAREKWQKKIGYEAYGDLHNAHVDEHRKESDRRAAALADQGEAETL